MHKSQKDAPKILADYYRKTLKFLCETGNIEIAKYTGPTLRRPPKGEIVLKQGNQTPKSSDLPLYLFHQGNNQEAYSYFGAHLCEQDGQPGAMFRVWAPHARAVTVVGDFNNWAPDRKSVV